MANTSPSTVTVPMSSSRVFMGAAAPFTSRLPKRRRLLLAAALGVALGRAALSLRRASCRMASVRANASAAPASTPPGAGASTGAGAGMGGRISGGGAADALWISSTRWRRYTSRSSPSRRERSDPSRRGASSSSARSVRSAGSITARFTRRSRSPSITSGSDRQAEKSCKKGIFCSDMDLRS